jgi:hypothetical protein
MTECTLNPETPSPTPNDGIDRRLGAAGFGLFLIWAGLSFLMDIGWGVGLIGTAAVIFLTQGARRFCGLHLERFWVAVGVVFLLAGAWELYRIPLDLGPVLLIVAGGAVLMAAWTRGRGDDGRRSSSRWCGWCRPRHARHT